MHPLFALDRLERRCLLSVPTQFLSRGPGGGGALFSPSFSPYNSAELFAPTDVSELFHSTNAGQSWTFPDFRQIQGGRDAQVQFTSDPDILYNLDYSPLPGDVDTTRPSKSTDGGVHWSPLANWDSADPAYALYADPAATNRLVVSDYGSLYFSSDGGATFQEKFTAPDTGQGCFVAGAFFDGANIYVGTSAGLLVSTDNGVTFNLSTVTGLPSGTSMFSFTGAKQNGVTRLFCVLLNSADVFNGMLIEGVPTTSYSGVYTLDVGNPSWTLATSGIPAGEFPNFVSMARNDISTAYVAGTTGGVPVILKTTDGGGHWSDVLFTTNNQNIATGWQGQGGDRGWGYSQLALGFEVDPVDPNTLAFTDYGFVHLSTDGGATWRQAYVNAADQNPAGAATPQHKPYHGIGLEDTSAHWLTWADANDLVAGYTDIYGVRSADSGASWAFPTGASLSQNTIYQISQQSGILYAATSNTHDIYQSTHLTNSTLDGGLGRVLFSTDKGASWSILHDFGHPVIYTASDPTNFNRLYAAVINSTSGGIYVTNNLSAGTASTWTKLANPPRTEGHPFNIDVLTDGTLVVSYSGHRNPTFTASSGVFLSIDGGQTWSDRTLIGGIGQPGMQYLTKDITIDPTDPTQSTWYAAVRSGYGGDGSANGKGGLYRTTNRGLSWTRIFSTDSCESATILPTGEMFLATLDSGLWYSNNPSAASPTFTQVNSYPFHQPERIFVNPFKPTEIWVASFGYGLAVASTAPSAAAAVVARQVFYNGSAFDNNDESANAADDNAIAPDKTALLPGQPATAANFTNFFHGINGIMIDVSGLASATALSAADFTFKAGVTSDPSTWLAAPAPASITVRPGAGVGGSDRIELLWPDNAIQNEWLGVTMKADAVTGLAGADTFYFGNLIGDANGSGSVTVADIAMAKSQSGQSATILSPTDFNRSGQVTVADTAIAKAYDGNSLLLFTAPVAVPVPQAAAQPLASAIAFLPPERRHAPVLKRRRSALLA
jgi:photosystem II stability/assembly factor-like uncharacterized protein